MTSRTSNLTKWYRKKAAELRLFDANVWLGRAFGDLPFAEELHIEDLQKALDKNYLSACFVSHTHSFKTSAQDGNNALLKIAQNLSENKYLVWTGLPLYPDGETILPDESTISKVKGLRLFPSTHKYPFKGWILDSLCRWLMDRNMPLLLWHVEIEMNDLYELAKKYPKLQIIVESQNKKILYITRALFSIMQECSNLLIEISNFVGPGFIEYAVGQFGPERMIYGSFMPFSDPFVPMGMILDADISDGDKKLIAGENIRRIIQGVKL